MKVYENKIENEGWITNLYFLENTKFRPGILEVYVSIQNDIQNEEVWADIGGVEEVKALIATLQEWVDKQ